MAAGYVYILFNPSLRMNQFKIGLTTQTPEQRARDLSRATGIPQPFEVAYSVYINDCSACERLVHEKLSSFRAGKEFFEIPLAIAVQTVNDVADVVGRATPTKNIQSGEASRQIAEEGAIETEEISFSMPDTGHTRSRARGMQRLSEKGTVTFEDHFEKTDQLGKEILLELRRGIKGLANDVSEKVTRFNRIAYSRNRVFLEVKVHKDRVRILFLDIALDDPRNVVQKVPATHGWGRLKYLMNLRSLDDLEYAVRFIEASYKVAHH